MKTKPNSGSTVSPVDDDSVNVKEKGGTHHTLGIINKRPKINKYRRQHSQATKGKHTAVIQ